MRVCALVGAADFNREHFCNQHFDYVIAVDGGYMHLQQLEVEPDMVIGDFDSLAFVPDHPHIKSYPSRKDKVDMELAFDEVRAKGFDLVLMYGCLGGRFDLSFTTYQLLAHFSHDSEMVYAIGLDTVACVLNANTHPQICFSEHAKGILSMFALSPELRGVDEIGLEYTLDKATLSNERPLGVSNAFAAQISKISIQSGIALLFFPTEAFQEILR